MIKRLLCVYLLLLFTCALPAQGVWEQKADYGGGPAFISVGFSIGTKGYVGTGGGCINDDSFWEYDPNTDAWMQKADFGGGARASAVGFAIGNKGYIGTGGDDLGNRYNDFWEYDPNLNTWTRKTDCPGVPRFSAMAMSIAGKGYIAGGYSGVLLQDLWEYDPPTDTWTQKANLPYATADGSCFVSGYKGYLTIFHSTIAPDELWEYYPIGNVWTQKSNLPTSCLDNTVAFAIGTTGFVCTGVNHCSSSSFPSDCWAYDILNDTWYAETSFPGITRWGAVAFAIGNSGYVSTGYHPQQGGSRSDHWKFTPNSKVASVNDTWEQQVSVSVFPNPCLSQATFTISSGSESFSMCEFILFDNLGRVVQSSTIEITCNATSFQFDRNELSSGSYMYQFVSDENVFSSGSLILQ